MQPFYEHAGVTIYQGDARTVLPELPGGSVHCCVTSPPYWGLRDYGTAKWEGGSAACDHKGPPKASEKSGLKNDGRPNPGRNEYEMAATVPFRKICGKCGAVRVDSQLGLEATPEEYVARMVEVFREVRRVLRDDGTLWINLGDSYAGGGDKQTGRGDNGTGSPSSRLGPKRNGLPGNQEMGPRSKISICSGLKPKDLVGIPWRVAFALQADGWYLRSEIIWAKPNPMPESVTDRPTKAHEQIFLLAKSRRYFYDAGAIKEPLQTDPRENYPARSGILGRGNHASSRAVIGSPRRDNTGGYAPSGEGRNKRSVWTVTADPFPEAHFATFPPDLIKPCIFAGCPAGGVVLDPFMGAGTTALVSKENGRQCIGIELNPEYCKMIEKRLRQEVLDFEEAPVTEDPNTTPIPAERSNPVKC